MNAIKTVWKVICYPLLYIVMQLSVTFLYAVVYGLFNIFKNAELISNMPPEEFIHIIMADMNIQIPAIIGMVLCFLTIYLIQRKEWRANKFWKAGGISAISIILCLVLSFGMNLFTGGIITLTNAAEVFTDYQEVTDYVKSGNFVLALLDVGILGPILEEVIFRGIVLRYLLKKTKLVPAILIQALLFSVIHLNTLQCIYAFAFGVVFGLVFIWLDSLWAVIAVHIGTNATSVFANHLFGDAELYGVGLYALTIMSLVISLGILYVLYRKKPKGESLYRPDEVV